MSTFADIQKVIIIGGGPAALLAAIRLKRANAISSVLYEIRPKPSTLGGAIGIPANGLRLLHSLGLYEELVAKGALTSEIILHALNGCTMGEIDLASYSEHKTGFAYLRIQRTDLMETLLETAAREGIQIEYGKTLSGIEEVGNKVTARFADGTTDVGDFVLGCDGIHSAVRSLYVDPGMVPEYTGICNMFSLVPTAKLDCPCPHLDSMHATITTNGLFALSPTTATRDLIYWFFSREVPAIDPANHRDGWEDQDKIEENKQLLLSLLNEQGSSWVTLQREMILKTESFKFYPIHKLPTGRPWARGRCLVIGDAAHAMPPHASQGVSMALEDVFLLSKLFQSEKLVTPETLEAYVSKRRQRTETILRNAERNGAIREQKPAWRTRVDELMLSGGLRLYKMAGLQRLGLGQRDALYDIESEVL
ncbi:hypothetical protein N0V90_009201 [Kalmusia sp. IMI 367209]|nr:hypothetical protein N0V90_009201 [Kalmusia sp. IMI 367209]